MRIGVAGLFACLTFAFGTSAPGEAFAREQAPSTVPIITVTGAPLTPSPDPGAPTSLILTRAEIANSGVSRPEELQRISPGLSVGAVVARGAPSYVIRGAGVNDTSTNAESAIGLYVDDVALPYAIMAKGLLFDLDRIEIERGPQGVASGRSDVGGRILFKSAAPQADFHYGARLSADRFGVTDAEAFVTGPAMGGAARLSGRMRYSADGYQKSVSRPDDRLGAQDEGAVRGVIMWGTARATLRLSAHWDRDKSENLAPAAIDGRWGGYALAQPRRTPFDARPYFTAGDNEKSDWAPDFRPQRNDSARGASARMSYDAGNGAEFVSISAVEFLDRDDRIDISGVPFADTRWRMRDSIRTASEEIRIRKNWSKATLAAGFYYGRDDFAERALLGLADSPFNPVLGVKTLEVRSRQQVEQFAVFADANVALSPRLAASFGFRATDFDKSWRSCAYDTGDGSVAAAWNKILTPFVIRPAGLPDPGPLAAGGCAIYSDVPGDEAYGTFAPFTAHRRDDGAAWRAMMSWRPSDRSRIWVGASEGFKSGGFNGVVTQTRSQSAPYRPEKLRAFEAGLAWQGQKDSPDLKLTAYYNDYTDKQVTTYIAAPVGNLPALANIPKSQIWGVEAEAALRLAPSLKLSLSGTYSESQIRKFTQVDAVRSAFPDTILVDSKGFPLPNVPRWQARASAEYSARIVNGMTLSMQAGLSFRSKSFGSADGRNPLSDYLLADARVSLSSADDRVSASIWGRNLTGEYYWTSAYVTNGVFARAAGEPAIVGLTLAVRR